ncbi:MAG: hypothetical protein Q8927_04775 [Bacteroidota bacterium]|nr:hypothetical protein [Bacteroidota bacterium]MDP4215492.1 hypothetical protein [Bacteroidota bacterium]MDP4247397.1 hypothetical protein [Bacteroidota bacterium]MDP4252551.1 hypothetical protein [Bacteroidota bacterium]MDP4257813.1 hypothetical protein [Bacteroidota bacterium]
MLKKRTFFWLGTLLLLLVGLGWGFYLYNKPHQSAGQETASFTLDADSLFAEYQKDEQTADKRYLGKVVQVRGRLAEIQRSGASEVWILSVKPGNAPAGGGVNCQLFAPTGNSSPRPKAGDEVTVKGRCTGFLMDVNLADCVPQ